ncbi:MAG: FAD-binding protein, partial [Halovenus sp.]
MTVPTDVLIVGGGVAGRSAGIFTARHGMDTLIV